MLCSSTGNQDTCYTLCTYGKWRLGVPFPPLLTVQYTVSAFIVVSHCSPVTYKPPHMTCSCLRWPEVWFLLTLSLISFKVHVLPIQVIEDPVNDDLQCCFIWPTNGNPVTDNLQSVFQLTWNLFPAHQLVHYRFRWLLPKSKSDFRWSLIIF